jgi:hypothetical protein
LLAIVSSNSSEKSNLSRNDVSGVYVREYAVDVTHPKTGNNIGIRKIRDTIFIEQADNNYLISNRKWRMNDYDQEGETAKILNPTNKNILPRFLLTTIKEAFLKAARKNTSMLKLNKFIISCHLQKKLLQASN